MSLLPKATHTAAPRRAQNLPRASLPHSYLAPRKPLPCFSGGQQLFLFPGHQPVCKPRLEICSAGATKAVASSRWVHYYPRFPPLPQLSHYHHSATTTAPSSTSCTTTTTAPKFQPMSHHHLGPATILYLSIITLVPPPALKNPPHIPTPPAPESHYPDLPTNTPGPIIIAITTDTQVPPPCSTTTASGSTPHPTTTLCPITPVLPSRQAYLGVLLPSLFSPYCGLVCIISAKNLLPGRFLDMRNAHQRIQL